MGTIFLYVLIGFLAQMIDGTLGMAYGVSCRTFLKTFAGLPSSMASAVIHIAEIPASLASGIAHMRIQNTDRQLLYKLLIPGMAGGVLGAWFLSNAGDRLEPYIDVYLIIMGIIILRKVFAKENGKRSIGNAVYPLGFAGGFMDAAGGGGWGPIVTGTLTAAGQDVKKTIGTVNAAEFLVTVAETTAFTVFIRDFMNYWQTIAGLIIGGVMAAPAAAILCRKIPAKPLMFMVGLLIIVMNLYNLLQLF